MLNVQSRTCHHLQGTGKKGVDRGFVSENSADRVSGVGEPMAIVSTLFRPRCCADIIAFWILGDVFLRNVGAEFDVDRFRYPCIDRLKLPKHLCLRMIPVLLDRCYHLLTISHQPA